MLDHAIRDAPCEADPQLPISGQLGVIQGD